MVQPEEAAEAEAVAVAEQEQALEPAQALELARARARELVAVTRPSLSPRSFDSRYHRNP